MDRERYRQALLITRVGIGANVILVVLKFIAGIVGRSSALVADAVHSLSDFGSDIIVIAGFKLANRPADRNHRYGHGKYETMSAMVLGVVLIATSIGIFLNGVQGIRHNLQGTATGTPGIITLFVALSSVFIKQLLYVYTKRTGRSLNSRALMANAIHHRSDALSSLGVAVGVGGAILLGGNWRILDPIAAIVVSIFIIQAALSILKKSGSELLETSCEEETETLIKSIILKVPGADNPHNLKTRRVGSDIAVDVHINVEANLTVARAHEIATEVERKIRDYFGEGTFVSVHIEPADD